MNLLVTNAGLVALVNAEQTGTESVVIGSIQFGSGQYTPTKTQTALQTPIKTLTALSGGAVSANTLHVTAEDGSTDAYTVNEVGVFLADGTLFAVASQNTPILQKASEAIALLSVDIALADHSAATVTVGDTNFFNPQATTETKGVVELATADETKAGTDAARAVTPASLKAELDVRDSKVVHTTGNETIAGTKTFTSAPAVKNGSPFIYAQNTDAVKGAAPSIDKYMGVSFIDSEGNNISSRLAIFETCYSTSGDISSYFGAYKPEHGSTVRERISVVYPADGSPYATAPTPADANDSSTKIATTAWVKAKADKYLPLAGGKMSGKITFSYENVISRENASGRLFVFGGTGYDSGASLLLCGKDYAEGGLFAIYAFDGTNRSKLVGSVNGMLTWNDKNIVRTVNSVSADAAGNVVIENVTGNAETATKLKTAKTIKVNLGTDYAAPFDGSENVTPGVTGVLPVSKGGTGSNVEKYLQLVGGNMTGTIAARHSIDDATAVPSSNQYQTAIVFKDNNNLEFGHLQTASYADTGKLLIKLSVADGVRNGNTYGDGPATHFIGVGMDASGTPYTVAPTPPAEDDSENIATTAWVRNTVDAMIDDEGVVHIAGNETISGAKTFSAATAFNGVVNLNATVIGGAGRDIWVAHASGETANRSVIQSGNAYADGASLYLLAKDYSTNGGAFQINAHNGTNVKTLLGKPDGTLTWGGTNVTLEGDCLPLSGGTMSGKVSFSVENAICRNVTDGRIFIFGGNNSTTGAFLELRGKDYGSGSFVISAYDGTTRINLQGHASGALSWNNKNIVCTDSYSNAQRGYYKLSNGLIIQWMSAVTITSGSAVTLPTAFTSTNYAINITDTSSGITFGAGTTRTTTTFTPTISSGGSRSVHVIAIGY